MDPAAIITLLEAVIPQGIALYRDLKANGHSSQTLDQLLNLADSQADKIINTADAEIAKVDGKQ